MNRLGTALLFVGFSSAVMAGCARESYGDVAIAFHYSRFGPNIVTVPAGVPVTFTLRNEDPIEHEWIVGLSEVHERHRLGTEAVHDQLPTEVTVPALSTRTTTLTFDEPAEFSFICHLPGHEAYGMRGILRVLAR
jgi:uncharacterized cupredoxin-like copper-binding protein